jgi:hypothetical protein
MALTAMRIIRGTTGAIGIGLTDTGATIDKGRSGSPIRPLSIVHSKMKIEGQASPFTRLRASVRL